METTIVDGLVIAKGDRIGFHNHIGENLTGTVTDCAETKLRVKVGNKSYVVPVDYIDSLTKVVKITPKVPVQHINCQVIITENGNVLCE